MNASCESLKLQNLRLYTLARCSGAARLQNKEQGLLPKKHSVIFEN
jgi:hypothetical protein